MRRIALSATLAGLLLFTAACGDDEESSNSDDSEEQADERSDDEGSDDDGSNDDSSNDDSSNDDTDVSLGNIPGVSEDCEDIYSAWLTVFAGVGTPGGQVSDAETTIDALQDALPDDLDDDAAVFGAAISQYYAVLAEHIDDANAYSDPAVLAALEGLGSEEITEASDNINAYFEEACPAAG